MESVISNSKIIKLGKLLKYLIFFNIFNKIFEIPFPTSAIFLFQIRFLYVLYTWLHVLVFILLKLKEIV